MKKAKSKERRAESIEQRAKSIEQRAKSIEQRAKSEEQRAEGNDGYVWCPGHRLGLGGQQITIDVCLSRQGKNPKLCHNAARRCRHFKETA